MIIKLSEIDKQLIEAQKLLSKESQPLFVQWRRDFIGRMREKELKSCSKAGRIKQKKYWSSLTPEQRRRENAKRFCREEKTAEGSKVPERLAGIQRAAQILKEKTGR